MTESDEQPSAKPTSAAKTDPMVGTQVGAYKITRLLGIGGMARVYEAYHQSLDRRVALKILSEQHEDDSELTQRFHREARALARLEHPRIVTLFEVGETERSYFIAMRFIDGQTLTTVLKKLSKQRPRQYMPYEQVFTIVADVAEALDYAHTQGVIHRDVKPSNIMLTDDGHAILTDFGLMMHTDEGSTLGTAFGTPRYIAPEQAVASQRAVPQSDMYSLGIVIYEMLTGETPFNQESPMSMALSHITNPPPPLRSLRSELSAAVEYVVLKALEKKPEDRYPLGHDLVEALREALDLPEPASRATSPRRASTSPQKTTTAVTKAVIPAPSNATPTMAVEHAQVSSPGGSHEEFGSTERMPVPSTQILTPSMQRFRFGLRHLHLGLIAGLLMTIVIIGLVVTSVQALIQANTLVIVAADATDTPISTRVRLVYAPNWLAIYNPTDKPAALKGLVISRGIQTVDTAREVGGTALDGLPPGQCVEIRLQGSDKSEPFMCANPNTHVIYVVNLADRVWYDATGAASTFMVRLDQTILQNCLTSLNTCEFAAP